MKTNCGVKNGLKPHAVNKELVIKPGQKMKKSGVFTGERFPSYDPLYNLNKKIK